MKKWGENFWTEPKWSSQNKIFSKKGLTTKKIAKCVFEDLAWKTNLQEKLITKRRKKQRVFFFKKNKDNFVIFQKKKTKRQFFKSPKKKIDKRKSRTVNFKQKKNQQIRKKHGTHKATARRKEEKTRDLPQIKAAFQKDRHKFMKKWKFFGNKKSDAEMKKNW